MSVWLGEVRNCDRGSVGGGALIRNGTMGRLMGGGGGLGRYYRRSVGCHPVSNRFEPRHSILLPNETLRYSSVTETGELLAGRRACCRAALPNRHLPVIV